MQSLLRLLRTRFARLALRRRKMAAKAPDPTCPDAQASRQSTVLSYDSFR